MECTICEKSGGHEPYCPKMGSRQQFLYDFGFKYYQGEVFSEDLSYLLGRRQRREMEKGREEWDIPLSREREAELAASPKVRAAVEAGKERKRLYEAMRLLRKRTAQRAATLVPSRKASSRPRAKRKKRGVRRASA